MEEIWKDVPNYEGFYQISNFGNVKSLDRITKKNRLEKRKIFGRSLNKIECSNKYLSVRLSKNGIVKMKLIHRLVAISFLLNNQNKTQVNHIDGNKQNNILSNLEWVTHSENAKHAYINGLSKIPILFGENNGMSKKHKKNV